MYRDIISYIVLICSLSVTSLAGCARSPQIRLTNASPSAQVSGYIQIPAILTAGYPPRSSRERIEVGPRETRVFKHRGSSHAVQNWSSYIYGAFRERDGSWRIIKLDAKSQDVHEIDIRVLLSDASGKLEMEVDPRFSPSYERALNEAQLLEMLGKASP